MASFPLYTPDACFHVYYICFVPVLLDFLFLLPVVQCQTHFGARQEVATEGDLRVSSLCTEWEAVLCHGVKKPRAKMRAR